MERELGSSQELALVLLHHVLLFDSFRHHRGQRFRIIYGTIFVRSLGMEMNARIHCAPDLSIKHFRNFAKFEFQKNRNLL